MNPPVFSARVIPGKTVCGLFFAGDCADFAPPANRHACSKRTPDGAYANCATTAVFPVKDSDDDDDEEDDEEEDDDDDDDRNDRRRKSSANFDQVITVYLRP